MIERIFLLFFTTICCNQKAPNTAKKNAPSTDNNILTTEDSAAMLRKRMKGIYPSYNLKYDSIIDIQKCSEEIKIDTIGFTSFNDERYLLGKLTNIVAVKTMSHGELILKSDNLKLWVYNVDVIKTKIPDTVLISPYIYSMHGNEMTPGFPTLLTKITICPPSVLHPVHSRVSGTSRLE